jgi:hypothetical protein
VSNSRHALHSIGVGLIGLGLFLLAAWRMEWDVPGHIFLVAFMLGFGGSLAAPMVLTVPVGAAEAFHESARHYFSGRKMLHEARALDMPTSASTMPSRDSQNPVVLENGAEPSPHSEAWRKWLVESLNKAKVRGGIHYNKCMDACLEYDVWKNQFHRMLFAMGMSGTITGGQKTNLTNGLTIDAAIDIVKAWKVLPCPDYPPPAFQDEPHTEQLEHAIMQ